MPDPYVIEDRTTTNRGVEISTKRIPSDPAQGTLLELETPDRKFSLVLTADDRARLREMLDH